MGETGKKTDKMDADGLGILLRNGTLPEVWIPPDQRELLRLRMLLVQQRTRLKNRIQGALGRYNIQISGMTDVFGMEGRLHLAARLGELPPHTRQSVALELVTMGFCEDANRGGEEATAGTDESNSGGGSAEALPWVGRILSMVMTLEIGRVERFASAERLASYAGLFPRVHSSGGRTRLGQICGDVNRYLKWAFIEAGNLAVIQPETTSGSACTALVSTSEAQNESPAVVAVAGTWPRLLIGF